MIIQVNISNLFINPIISKFTNPVLKLSSLHPQQYLPKIQFMIIPVKKISIDYFNRILKHPQAQEIIILLILQIKMIFRKKQILKPPVVITQQAIFKMDQFLTKENIYLVMVINILANLKKINSGQLLFNFGGSYTGEFKNSEYNGKGKYLSANGDKYVGEFKNSKKYGYGEYYFINGDTYIGNFEDDQFEGEGKWSSQDGRSYVGEWSKNQMHGNGLYISNKGSKYEGEFEFGKRQGKGTYNWGDGRQYVGEFKDNIQNGEGKFVDNDGTIILGKWNKGEIEQIQSMNGNSDFQTLSSLIMKVSNQQLSPMRNDQKNRKQGSISDFRDCPNQVKFRPEFSKLGQV